MSRSGELVPEFSAGFPDNVTVQRESAAFLDCPVKNPGDRPVSYPLVGDTVIPATTITVTMFQISWVRIRDWHILTNGLVRFTTDDRFNVLYKEGSFNWVLQVMRGVIPTVILTLTHSRSSSCRTVTGASTSARCPPAPEPSPGGWS